MFKLPFSNKEIFYSVEELKELTPFRVDEIYIPTQNQLILSIYAKKERYFLFFEVRSHKSRVLLLKKGERPKQEISTPIQNVFRNYLSPSFVKDIKQINDDRVIDITFSKIDEIFHVIIEMMGNRGNIFLTDSDYNTISSLFFVSEKTYIYPENSKFELIKDGYPYGELRFLKDISSSFGEEVKNQYTLGIIDDYQREIEKKIKKALKKKFELERQLNENSGFEIYKIQGELLKSSLYLLKRGDKSISVVNYFDSDLKTITIPLKEELSPIDNMNYLFKKYEKYRRGVTIVKSELEKIEESIISLQSRLEQIEKGDIDILDELESSFELRDVRKKIENPPSKKEEHKPFKIYGTQKGYKILVGKSSKDNDYLTFKVASGNDIWLHVVSYSGSHVVIKRLNKKDEVPISVIYLAANLAILNSKAPKNDSIEVTYTFQKYVKKPRNAPAGAVIFTQEKRVYLQYDSKLLDKLEVID
ncbi:DUF814 domain-containing protein [bacterium]|nr:DUF814 domain-containing protein [bacterium]